MRFNKWIIGLAAVGVMACAAHAQYFPFNSTRTLVLAPMENIVPATLIKTNASVDRGYLIDDLTVNISCVTNTGTGGGALTATIEGASDNTNFTALSNYALITSNTTFNIANYGLPTPVTNANAVLLPGLLTTPAAATAGFATPYLASLQYTNTGAVTISSGGNYVVAFRKSVDLPRYIHIVFNPTGGTVTNYTVEALLTATPITPTAD